MLKFKCEKKKKKMMCFEFTIDFLVVFLVEGTYAYCIVQFLARFDLL